MALFAPGVAAGAVQGLDAYQQRMLQQQQMAERAQLMQQRAYALEQARAAQARQLQANQGAGSTLSSLYAPPPPVGQPPAPGQASVPMQPPGMGGAQASPVPQQGMPQGQPLPPMGQGAPQPPQIPPYRTVQGMQQSPPQASQPPSPGMAPPPVGQPQGAPQQPQLTVKSLVETMRANGVPEDQWLPQLERLKPVMDEQNREIVGQISAKRAAQQQKYEDQTQDYRTRDLALREKNAESLNASRAQRDERLDRSRTSGGERGPTAGNMNQFAARETKEMAPVTLAQQQSQQLRGLIATADPASSAKIQQLFTMYLQSGRNTNEQYKANKNFGSMYDRGINAITKMVTGDYTETNKQQLMNVLDSMDKNVFDVARKNINEKYAKQAKAMKIDPSFADNPNAYVDDASGGSATGGLPEGWSVKVH